MRRFSGRSVAVVMLAVSLSVVPVGVASASPWTGFGLDGGFFAKAELLLTRVWLRWAPEAEVAPPRGQAQLKAGTIADPDS